MTTQRATRRVTPPPGPITEAHVLDLLRRYHTHEGNGGSGEYAFLTHVRNAAGHEATRTLDAVAVSLWRSRGLVIEGFEVKVARSDWLHELRTPEKMEASAHLVDKFSLVSVAGVVREGEVPVTWGHLEVSRSGTVLRRHKAAPLLHGAVGAQVSRSVLVTMLRAAGAAATREGLPGCATRDQHEQAINAALSKQAAQHWADTEHQREQLKQVRADLNDLRRELAGSLYVHPEELTELVRRVAADERAARNARAALLRAREELARLLASLDATLS